MHLSALVCTAVLLLGAAPTASPAPSGSPTEIARSRLDTMLRTGHADAAWFADSFLAQVTIDQVNTVLASLTTALGAYQSIEYTPEKFVAHFARGTDDVQIHLDAQNKIDGLLFKPPVVTATSLDDAFRSLRKLQGTLAYVVVERGRTNVAALNASEPLAVGSAFKLAVLNGLVDRIRRNERRWSDVVSLQEGWKSLPSGVLQSWPARTPLTIATYAAEMISISDNTAADALAHITGRAAIAPYAADNFPFLTTREVFTLKSSANAKLRSAYLAAATPAARATVLRRVDALPLPAIAELSFTAPDPEIEWHFSVSELCRLMNRVAALPLMSINPGVAEKGVFRSVAYKGGSDTGIINMTTMVTTKRGTQVCFSATLNNAAKDIDEQAFGLAYATALRYLAGR
jgi:beta-lactamase class A